jgi:hypothetical protein
MEGENMKLSWQFTLLCMLVLLALLPSTSNADDPVATVCLEPAEITVRPGEQFGMSVMIYDVVEMMGYIAELHYLPAIITIEDIQVGEFVENNYWAIQPVGPMIDNDYGMALLGFMKAAGPITNPSGSGELAIITLMAQGEGQSFLAFENTEVLHDWGHMPIYTQNARITVEPYHVYLPLVLR